MVDITNPNLWKGKRKKKHQNIESKYLKCTYFGGFGDFINCY